MRKEFIVKEKTLTGLVKWLNSEENVDFKKQNNSGFTTSDVQNYIKRGYLPEYMGGNIIEKANLSIDVKVYNIVK